MARFSQSYNSFFKAIKLGLPFVFAFSLLTLIGSCQKGARMQEQILNHNWQISGDSIALDSIIIPAEVHLELAKAGHIPEPFNAGAEKELQWISRSQWVWETDFTAANALFKGDIIELVFEGIDTYAHVYLNDELLFTADNMFRKWRIPVKGKLLKTSNRLKIIFPPSPQIIDSLAEVASVKLPDNRAFLRKAAYQSGWDWAPEYRTLGLWKNVKLESWSQLRVDGLSFVQQEVNANIALIDLVLAVEVERVRTYKLQLFSNDRKLIEKSIHFEIGDDEVHIPFEVEHPKLWWPNGMGEQPLTEFEVKLFDGNEIIFEQKKHIGFRHIALIQEADSIGKSFYFQVNGKPMYAKGANYVPEDMFPTRMNRKKTRDLLIDAKNARMNMLRVWGGGIYPDDYFYALCDSLGLLVWQDFMFANALYPADSAFLHNVKTEVEQQVKRLRGRTALALWCGNNEIDEGFVNWGWQNQFEWSQQQSDSLWNNYQMLFENLIPEVIKTYDPQTAYWPSSPLGGWGHDESYLSGDVHYWGVWWGEQPFELYQQKIGRFNSEFGFQAMPAIATLNTMVKKDLQWPGSPEIENFQKHPRGTQLIDTYMQRDFPVPNAIDEYVYVSQLVQLYGLEMAIEGQRLSRPHSMGTLFWQLNDAWPAISWSVIDYYRRPKATYYHLQRLYNQYLIGVEVVHNKIIGIFLNESQSKLNVRANFDLLDFEGNLLHSSSLPMVLKPNEINRLDAGFAAEVLKNVNQRKIWMRVRCVANDEVLAEKYHFFVKPKNLLLPKHDISLYLMPDADKIEIVLSSTVFLKNLQLTSNDDLGRWETNFFDLPPGKPRRINFYPSGNIEIGKLRFMTSSLNELIN